MAWLRLSWLHRHLGTGGDTVVLSPALGWWSRGLLLVMLNLIFAAVVVSHQLSPFVVIAGMAGLAALGLVRPWWLVLGPGALAFGYLATRLSFISPHYGLLSSFNPIANLLFRPAPSGRPLPGPALATNASLILSAGIWCLAIAGGLRRLREGSSVLTLLTLMLAPVTVLLGQNYGGEASLRVYLFSLPWAALLAASALVPVGRWRLRHFFGAAAALLTMLALLIPSSFGLAEVHEVSPQEVQASQYLSDHAPEGSVLVVAAPNFPDRAGAGYNHLPGGGNLFSDPRTRHRMLGARDLPPIEARAPQKAAPKSPGALYVALSREQKEYGHMYGVVPDGSLDELSAAMEYSPNWKVFYRNDDTVIYQFAPQHSATVNSG
jgi:hypothetical protein